MRFIKENIVLVISAVVALITVAFVPPDTTYLTYIEWDTIACLFCVIAIANAFRLIGALDRVARLALLRLRTPRAICAALIWITGGLSMLVTNDMALIVMLPLSAAVLAKADALSALPVTFVLQGLAANLCGMLLPFGNPQNLFIYSRYGLHLREFLVTMMPVFVLSCIIIGMFAKISFRSCSFKVSNVPSQTSPLMPISRRKLVIYFALAALVPLGIFRVVPVWVCAVVTLATLAIADRRALCEVDYSLLATFICFFVFAGNMARMPFMSSALSTIMASEPLVTSVLVSQVISNVPAAVLLAHFTSDWQALLIGVNIGGAGTLVGSLASLITLKYFQTARRIYASQIRATANTEDAAAESGCEHDLPARHSTTRFIGIFSAMNFAALALLLCAALWL